MAILEKSKAKSIYDELFCPGIYLDTFFDFEKYAYHYTNLDTTLNHILGGNNSLRLSQIKNANDLSESLGDVLQTDMSIGDCSSKDVDKYRVAS